MASKLQDIFENAIDLKGSERDAYIRGACGTPWLTIFMSERQYAYITFHGEHSGLADRDARLGHASPGSCFTSFVLKPSK